MERCEKIKEVILTDYIDAELKPQERARIDAHLKVCPGCKGFLAQVQKDMVLPFKEQNKEEVPQSLWPAIVEKITQEEVRPVRVFLPRLSPVMVSFLLAVLITSAIFFNRYLTNAKQEEQLNYLSSVFGPQQTTSEATSNFGTLIEEYFL